MSSPRKLLLAVFLLLGLIEAGAQYRFDSWTADKGLPQNSVFSITQTPDGYIWFTTFDGLVRFDGVNFKVFNKSNSKDFPTNRLRGVLAESDGTLWIVNENAGLSRFQNNQFRTFTTVDGLPSNNIFNVQKKSDDSLLIVDVDGIARINSDGSFVSTRRQDVRQFVTFVGPSGTTWEINKDGLFETPKDGGPPLRFDLPFYPKADEYEETYDFSALITFFEDADKALWFGAAGNLFLLQNGKFTVFTAKNGVPPSAIKGIARDGRGNLWIGTAKDGACRMLNQHFDCFNTANGLSSNEVSGLFLDREKTLWIATGNAGINRVTPQIIQPLSKAEGLAATNVYPILQDRSGAYWIGAFGGLARYADGKITNYLKSNGLAYEFVQALYEDRDGTLWVGSIGGVLQFVDGRSIDFTEKLGLNIGDQTFWDIHQTSDGAMWFASDHGLFKHLNGTTTHFTTKNGLPSDDIKVIYETRDGALWLGTTAGVARLKDGEISPFTEKDGLGGNFVRSIYEDEDGFLWFGTYDSGLSLYREGKFARIAAENGLFSNGVFAILPDSHGNFWMSSNQGIYRVARQQLIDFVDGKRAGVVSTAYNKSDGMLSTECNGGRQPAAIRSSDGRLWFATQNGVAIVDPESVPFNPLPPPVVIEDVAIDGNIVNDLSSTIQIEPGQNNLQINYSGLSFIKPEQVRFRYKLDGLDEDWTEAANRRDVFYPYLPPGEYVFRVMAANSDNVWSGVGASIPIKVLPPFYRTWWFITACALLIGAVAFLLFRRRISQLENARFAQEEFSRGLINAHESERRRIAAELHDSLGQSLAIIKNQAVFGSQTAIDLNAAKQQFDQISNQSARAISEVREISYNLRPYLLDRLGLTKAVKSMLNKIAEVGALQVHSEIDDVDGIFPAETEIGIYRILQESFNNILKHSEASEARVLIARNGRNVMIKIEDNGRGFDARSSKFDIHSTMAGERTGFGLFGMAERIKILGGSHTIESEIGKGTVVKIDLAVPENDGR
ncbi:MAG: hypothetical protein HOP17_15755 [Acidobacteria bacterium]|nr:hypothetical protein [Acidobacteriota bacterium]